MSNERIDLTQFEKITHEIHSFNVIINGEETTEYQRSDLWDTWELNEQQAAEGKALAVFTMDMQYPVCLIEGYKTAEEGLANAKAITHVPKMIAELKTCYEIIDIYQSTEEDFDTQIAFHEKGLCKYLKHPCGPCEGEEE